jgi:serine/threonine protein kinase
MSEYLEKTLHQLLQRAAAGDNDLASLNGHTLERKLGEGGMGAVFLVRNTATGKRVAIKLMLPQLALDETARKLFRREIANSMALEHQNIVKFLGFGNPDNLLFLLMEFLDGGSAASQMDRAGGEIAIGESTRHNIPGFERVGVRASSAHPKCRTG